MTVESRPDPATGAKPVGGNRGAPNKRMIGIEFDALLKEAEFTRELLGSGATQIRRANYASRGLYFQAFASLSTGLERIGKLCLMLDHALENRGRFPSFSYMQKEFGHDLLLIYEKSLVAIERRSVRMRFLDRLNAPVHRSLLRILSDFAKGDRYCNINLLGGRTDQNDPVDHWFKEVDKRIFDTCVSAKRKDEISNNARLVDELMSSITFVRYPSETGSMITSVEDASYRTGMYEAVAPWRQLYILQVIRFWVELLYDLGNLANSTTDLDVPHFGEIFSIFMNSDSYFRTRKTWDRL